MAPYLLRFDASISVENRESCWAASILPLGITVYAHNEEALEQRLDSAMAFLIKTYGLGNPVRISAYLNKHGVKHVVENGSPQKRTSIKEIRVPVG